MPKPKTPKAPKRACISACRYCQKKRRKSKAMAQRMGTYLRTVGFGYQVTGILDNQRVEDLARINGDLGRLGDLLKLWLTDDFSR